MAAERFGDSAVPVQSCRGDVVRVTQLQQDFDHRLRALGHGRRDARGEVVDELVSTVGWEGEGRFVDGGKEAVYLGVGVGVHCVFRAGMSFGL
jgi:hypothetical protein